MAIFKLQDDFKIFGHLVFLLVLIVPVAPISDILRGKRAARARLMEDLKVHRAVQYQLSPEDENDTVNIEFFYTPSAVLTIDEVEQSMFTIGYAEIHWQDPDLAWNTSDYAGLRSLNIPYDMVWHPHIVISNAAHEDYCTTDQKYQNLHLSMDGQLHLRAPLFTKTTCSFDLTNYPFDVQECDIQFLPFFDTDYNVSKSAMLNVGDFFTPSGEWTIIHTEVKTVSIRSSLSVITCTLRLRRSVVFYVICMLCPLVVTSSMTSLVFWIPPGSGEKMSFLVSMFLSNAVYLSFIAGTMPKHMEKVPRVMVYIIIVILECIFAMIVTVFVMRRYTEEQERASREQKQAMSDQIEAICQSLTSDKEKEPESDYGQVHVLTSETRSSPPTLTNTSPVAILHRLLLVGRRTLAFSLSKFSSSTSSSEGCFLCCQRKRKKRSIGCISSATWDKIFFLIFHATSIPAFYFLISGFYF